MAGSGFGASRGEGVGRGGAERCVGGEAIGFGWTVTGATGAAEGGAGTARAGGATVPWRGAA